MENLFAEHNREVSEVWARFWAGDPIRMPVIVGVSDRYFVLNPETNPGGVSFREYSEDPRLMFEMQARFAHYRRTRIPGDCEMGTPEEGWTVNVDFQNYYEAAWLGAEVRFPDGEVPYAVPLLTGDQKELLFARGLPDPFGGFMATAREYHERFREWAPKTVVEGQRVGPVGLPFMGTDGPFTLACELRGPDRLCLDLYEDPDYVRQLMDFLTESILLRLSAWRQYLGEPVKSGGFGFADDSILLLSEEMYREFVLPYHKRLAEGLSTGEEKGFCHCCGDAARHFKTMRDELNIGVFDTGFPVRHAELVRELGPDTVIQGGVPAELVRTGPPEAIAAASREIIESVKPLTRRFIFREGNDIPPGTPLAHMWALYEAGKQYGRYESGR